MSNTAFVAPSRAEVALGGSLSIPFDARSLRTEGYRSAGDGGGALYRAVNGPPTHPGGFQSYDGRWWELADSIINVRALGAVGDGITSDWQALRDAAGVAAARPGSRIHIPKGDYLFDSDNYGDPADPLTKAWVIPGQTVVQGEGNTSSRIKWRSTHRQGGGRPLLPCILVQNAKGVALEDFAIDGGWEEAFAAWQAAGRPARLPDSDPNFQFQTYPELEGAHLILFRSRPAPGQAPVQIEDVRCERLRLTNGRFMGLVIAIANNVLIQNCEARFMTRDALRADDCSDVRILGNRVRNCMDDAIVAHASLRDVTPSRAGVVIDGNQITESQGIVVLGARDTVVSNNSLTRVATRGVAIGFGGNEGATGSTGVVITGNSFHDPLFNGALTQYNGGRTCISLDGLQPQGVNGAPPPGVGATQPYAQFWTVDHEQFGVARPHSFYGVVISDNVMIRTLPAGGRYSSLPGTAGVFSDQGYWTPTGYVDPIVTDELLNCDGISVQGSLRSALFSGNNIACGGHGILFTGTNPQDPVALERSNILDGVIIQGNRFFNTPSGGVVFRNFGTTHQQNVTIVDNEADIDPFHVAPGRARENGVATGGWVSGDLSGGFVLVASDFQQVKIAVNLSRNRIRNASYPIFYIPSQEELMYEKDNVIYADPVSTGAFDVANRGIGLAPAVGDGYSYVIINSDPRGSNYGQVRNSSTRSIAYGQPTTGKWVQGSFVRSGAPQILSDGTTVDGWVRLTTGEGHTPGIDWTRLRSLAS